MPISSEIIKLLQPEQGPKNIVLTSHTNPDGDAVGSCLGLAHFFQMLGHKVRAMVPNAKPLTYQWLSDFDKILCFDKEPEICLKYIQEAEIIFILDYNAAHRSEGIGPAISEQSQARKMMIDHHLMPDLSFSQEQVWRNTASSTCELCFEFIRQGFPNHEPNQACLEAIYTGILTDTGGLRHATSPQLFQTVSQILSYGLDHNEMMNKVFNTVEVRQFQIQQYCLSNCLSFHLNNRLATLIIDQKTIQEKQIEKSDLEGLVNVLLRIQSVEVASILTEQNQGVKLSMRSKGEFSVQEICMQHFQGGGHRNASGGFSEQNLNETLAQMIKLVEAKLI